MTRATKQTPVPAPVELDSEPLAPEGRNTGTAARVATAAALGLAQGTGSVAKNGAAAAAYLLGQGLALAKLALARRKDVPVVEAATASAPSRRRLRRAAIFGAIGAAAVGGAVFWWSRRGEPAPVADQPPSLREAPAEEQTAQ